MHAHTVHTVYSLIHTLHTETTLPLRREDASNMFQTIWAATEATKDWERFGMLKNTSFELSAGKRVNWYQVILLFLT